jgi:hypothetical protein
MMNVRIVILNQRCPFKNVKTSAEISLNEFCDLLEDCILRGHDNAETHLVVRFRQEKFADGVIIIGVFDAVIFEGRPQIFRR